MYRALQVILGAGGLFALAIGLVEILIGPSSIPESVPVNAAMDSMLRFYAAIFGSYGVALLWCIRDVARKGRYTRFLAAAVFVGGVARVISALQVGTPPPFYFGLAAVEFILPLAIFFLQARVEAAYAANPAYA